MAFHDVRFPTALSKGSTFGAAWNTEVVRLNNGAEQRNQKWEYPLHSGDAAWGVKDVADMLTLRTFHLLRKGMTHGFRFKHHDDYTATGEVIGTGDDSTVDFQLIKTYTDGTYTFVRKITRPVSGTVVVYEDGSPVGSGITIDYDTGIVTFDVAPAGGSAAVVITADYEFDVPCRFDVDWLPATFLAYDAREAVATIVELRE